MEGEEMKGRWRERRWRGRWRGDEGDQRKREGQMKVKMNKGVFKR